MWMSCLLSGRICGLRNRDVAMKVYIVTPPVNGGWEGLRWPSWGWAEEGSPAE